MSVFFSFSKRLFLSMHFIYSAISVKYVMRMKKKTPQNRWQQSVSKEIKLPNIIHDIHYFIIFLFVVIFVEVSSPCRLAITALPLTRQKPPADLLLSGPAVYTAFGCATLKCKKQKHWLLSTVLPAAADHLPEVPDHHADPDPGPAAVCCAALPHSWGIAHSETCVSESPEFPWWRLHLLFLLTHPPQRDLLGIQHVLNSSEASLHQLTALLDCRGLNKVGSEEDRVSLTHKHTLFFPCGLTSAYQFVVCAGNMACLFSLTSSVIFDDFDSWSSLRLKSMQWQSISVLNLFLKSATAFWLHWGPDGLLCCLTHNYCCFCWTFSAFWRAKVW